MALFISQNALAQQPTNSLAKIQQKPLPTILLISTCFAMFSLSACQTAPTSTKTTATQTLPSVTSQKATAINQLPVSIKPPTALVIQEPAIIEPTSQSTSQTPIITQPDIIILAPAREDEMVYEPSIPSHNELLERARQNSQQRSQQSTTNNSNLPAFRNLMNVGTEQLKAGNINAAENSFTRAQRLAPKSSAVYFYLAQVALKKNQPRKAEAMARRGLTVAQDSNRRRALWQIILQSGQAQGNARVIKEAKQALR
ncbi:tetratricopeptide repeat protein [Psychrobacter glacincola]|uniref:tetratricopeptide repeat protein n=1 Tax=Psychrobacter glacincola TaxID=56810 RepID=UPI0039AF78E3